MRGKSFIFLTVLFLCACPAYALIEFKDGLTHNIDYEMSGGVSVDFRTPEMYTTVNVMDGGKIQYDMQGYENSRINILGGSINGNLYTHDNTIVDISGGFLRGHLEADDSSQVNISGGTITLYVSSHDSSQVRISAGLFSNLYSFDSSQINISKGSMKKLQSYGSSQINVSGGSVNMLGSYSSSQINVSGGSVDGDLVLWHQSMIQIFGYDFAVDGTPFGYGELTSILGGWTWDESPRHLTGTLLSGEPIDTDFLIGYDARIILIPEPATLLLLGLGAVMLRRKR